MENKGEVSHLPAVVHLQDSAALDAIPRAINTNVTVPSVDDSVIYFHPSIERVGYDEALSQVLSKAECQQAVSRWWCPLCLLRTPEE